MKESGAPGYALCDDDFFFFFKLACQIYEPLVSVRLTKIFFYVDSLSEVSVQVLIHHSFFHHSILD